MEQRYFDLKETAQYLGLSSKTLYQWVEEKKFLAYKLGRVWRFDKAEVDEFVKKGRAAFCYDKTALCEVGRNGDGI